MEGSVSVSNLDGFSAAGISSHLYIRFSGLKRPGATAWCWAQSVMSQEEEEEDDDDDILMLTPLSLLVLFSNQ